MAKLKLPDDEVSLWMDSTGDDSMYPKLAEDIEVDVAIIGAGITGLTSAYLLKKKGLKVAVVEQFNVGGGCTGYTTGKVTSQHNLIYSDLKKNLGDQTARQYGEANQAAIQVVRNIIKDEKIDCEWQEDDNYVFTLRTEELDKLKSEAKDASSLGLPATFETDTPLPFEVKGAVKFAGQGKFHSRKYLLGLAKAINGNGSYIFENTKVINVEDGKPAKVNSEENTILAENVVIATQIPYPLTSHTINGLVEMPSNSYIVAARVQEKISGMYITPGDPIISILPITAGEDNFLLVGGQSHFRGVNDNAISHFQSLADFSQNELGIDAIDYRWSAWDYYSYDRMPLIGKMHHWSESLYFASAFGKWGLTTGTVAGMIISDLMNDEENPWADTFYPERISTITSFPNYISGINVKNN